MRQAVLLGALLAACLPATAEAHTTITCDPCSLPYQRWVDEAKMPTPNLAVTVREEAETPCGPTALGCADWSSTLTIYMAEWRPWPRELFWHEMGHVIDGTVLPQWMRRRFMDILRLGDVAWYQLGSPASSPAERFADVWAQCALHPIALRGERHRLGFGRFWQKYAIGGTVAHNRTCRMLAKLPG